MIVADKNFTIKNAQGFTSPELDKDIYKIYVNVGSKISPMGTFDISGVVMSKVETVIGEETVVSYQETGYIFPVPNSMVNTPTLDVVTEASNITTTLLEEWNTGTDFTVEL